MACLSSGSRVYTTGLFVESWRVTIFYFDHMSMLQCESFDFRANTTWFAILLYAMHCSDNQNLGYLQFLRPWSFLEENITEQMREDELYPVAKMEGAVVDFPIRDSTEVITFANPDVLRKGIPDKDKQYVSFDILKTLATPIGLIGRATGVYEADMKLKISSLPVIPSALKLAFQPNYRLDPERALIADLRKDLPSWGDHLPEIYYSDIFTPEELGQPSVAFVQEEQQRKLHVTASRLYHKLWQLESVKEFQTAWLHCVQCHYIAFKEGKILHRDLSENNVMFWRKPIIDSQPVLKGVVNDWDMASRLNGSAFAPKSAAQHRTGTLPFMAMELLAPTPPGHYYRHDLESFLYILLWAALRYGFKGERRKLPSICSKWEGPGLDDALGFKSSLDSNAGIRKQILEAIPAEWASVKSAWIVPLLDLFKEARRSEPTTFDQESTGSTESPQEKKIAPAQPLKLTNRDFFMLSGPPSTDAHERVYDLEAFSNATTSGTQPDYDHSTYDGRLTYKTFMEAIGQSGEDPAK
ncbi:hypothetical protein BKA70DRAFT_1196855 [Coprinopsis sp. MPI-PUGE-AT-0042]|nr:hypothetical protein BKA70DRAFT_1196855 [Coprinopsis sp. MPI-PUGE-AT-0042]